MGVSKIVQAMKTEEEVKHEIEIIAKKSEEQIEKEIGTAWQTRENHSRETK